MHCDCLHYRIMMTNKYSFSHFAFSFRFRSFFRLHCRRPLPRGGVKSEKLSNSFAGSLPVGLVFSPSTRDAHHPA